MVTVDFHPLKRSAGRDRGWRLALTRFGIAVGVVGGMLVVAGWLQSPGQAAAVRFAGQILNPWS